MIRISGFAAVAACAAVMMATSCTDREMKTGKVTVNVQEALAPERTDSVKVYVNAEYPVSGISDIAMKPMCETISGAVFGQDYAGLEMQAAAEQWAADFVEEYRQNNMEMLQDLMANGEMEAAADNLGLMNWERRTEGYFSGKHGNVLSYTVFSYVYTGGAHGSSAEATVNIDTRTGTQVTEEDFFIPGYKETLAGILTARLRESMPDQESYDALFVKDIGPNGNFKVSEHGVTYIYGQYEIGPYYLGIIKVTVPWEELGDLVREHPAK